MSGYAAGPWTAVGFDLDPDWDGYSYDIMRISDGGGALLFECDCRDLCPHEARATMALTAAAPDLLAAGKALNEILNEFVRALVNGARDHRDLSTALKLAQVCERWEAAEKKAMDTP
jgi:hypothetical protein